MSSVRRSELIESDSTHTSGGSVTKSVVALDTVAVSL